MNYDDLIFVRVKNTTGNPDFFKFESMNPDYEIPFDEWTIWRTSDERLEVARLKLDAEDHFFPRPKIVNEHNVDAFLTVKKKTSDAIQRGEWVEVKKYNRKGKKFLDCSVCHYGEHGDIVCEVSKLPNFCPACGLPMTDEAVEILKKREAI